MKKSSISALLLCLASLPLWAPAQVPQLIHYQGRLVNGTNLVNGTVGLSIRLLTASSGGTVLYEDSNTVTVIDGLYSAAIGDNTVSGSLVSALTNESVWIEVAVHGVALSPRERLTSVAYALASRAEGLAGTIPDAVLSSNVAVRSPQDTSLQAQGTPIITSGFITGATITDPGFGYAGVPVVTVIDSSGSGATLMAQIADGQVTGLVVTSAGSLYSGGATLTIAPPGSNARQYFNGTNIFTGPTYFTNVGNVFYGDGAGLTNLAAAWGRSGNAGTTTNDFLGTTDGSSFQIRVSNHPVYRVEMDTNLYGSTEIPKIIQGHRNNTIDLSSGGAVIAGGGSAGFPNRIMAGADQGFIGSGQSNLIDNGSGGSFIGSGWKNSIHSNVFDGVVGGGSQNTIGYDADQAVIAGGILNSIAGESDYAAIAGGGANIASNRFSFVAGGGYNRALGSNSFAAGYQALATHHGAMLLSTPGDEGYFASITNDEIAFRAMGGMRVTGGSSGDAKLRISADPINLDETDTPSILLDQDGGLVSAFIALESTNNASATNTLSNALIIGSKDNDPALQLITGGDVRMTIQPEGKVGFGTIPTNHQFDFVTTNSLAMRLSSSHPAGSWFSLQNTSPTGRTWAVISSGALNGEGSGKFLIRDVSSGSTRFVISTNGFVGIGTASPTNQLHVNGTIQCVVLIQTSDRNAKADIAPVDTAKILEKLQRIPIATWTFKEHGTGTHIGPMAQDFHEAFGFGNSDTGITSIDADGVALAAIQALAKENEELKETNEQLRTRIESIEKALGL